MEDINELKIAEYFVLLKLFVQAHQNLTKTEFNYIKKILKAAKEIKNN